MIIPPALRLLTPDAWLLFATRFIRLIAYGSLSVVLVFYLVGIGLSEPQTGMLLTLTLVGDTFVSLYLTTRADRIGRRRMLIVGAVLMAAAGLVFASTQDALAPRRRGNRRRHQPERQRSGTVPVDRAGRALARGHATGARTEVFAWYSLAGSVATALGALAGGTVTRVLQEGHVPPVTSYRVVVILYAVLGVVLALLFSRLSRAAEAITLGEKKAFRATFAGLSGLDRSRDVVVKLSALFALDSFGGGFVVQSFAAYWFYLRFGVNPATLG